MGDNFATLNDLVIEKDSLLYGGKSFSLQGLSYPHIVHIISQHRPVVEDLYLRAAGGVLSSDVKEVAIEVAAQSETLLASIIACGMGAPDQAAKAAALPFSVQIEAIDKIVRLTIANEGGLEKLVEIVVRAVAAVAKLTVLKT